MTTDDSIQLQQSVCQCVVKLWHNWLWRLGLFIIVLVSAVNVMKLLLPIISETEKRGYCSPNGRQTVPTSSSALPGGLYRHSDRTQTIREESGVHCAQENKTRKKLSSRLAALRSARSREGFTQGCKTRILQVKESLLSWSDKSNRLVTRQVYHSPLMHQTLSQGQKWFLYGR